MTVGAFADAVAARLGLGATGAPRPSRSSAPARRCAATARCSPRACATGTRSRCAPAPPRCRSSRRQPGALRPRRGRRARARARSSRLARRHVHDRPRRRLRRHARRPVDVARAPARADRRPTRSTVVDRGSNNGTFVRDDAAAPPRALHGLQTARCCGSRAALISIRPSRPRHDALGDDGAGNVAFNRPPRVPRPWRRRSSSSPPRPASRRKARLPLAASLAPAADGRGHVPRDQEPADAAVHGADAGAGDLDLGRGPPRRQEGEPPSSSRAGRRSWPSSTSSCSDRRPRRSDERNAAAPDAGELVHRAVSHTADLWERRPTDPDFLHLRIGTADQPARYEVVRSSPAARRTCASAPRRSRGKHRDDPRRAGHGRAAGGGRGRPRRRAAGRDRAHPLAARPGGHAAQPARAR